MKTINYNTLDMAIIGMPSDSILAQLLACDEFRKGSPRTVTTLSLVPGTISAHVERLRDLAAMGPLHRRHADLALVESGLVEVWETGESRDLDSMDVTIAGMRQVTGQ